MNIKIAIKNKGFNKSYENLILFVDEQFNISSLKKHISKSEHSFILDLLKIKECSEFEICFFKLEVLNFSSTNRIRFSGDFLKPWFLKLILIFIKFKYNLYEIMLYMSKTIIFQWKKYFLEN